MSENQSRPDHAGRPSYGHAGGPSEGSSDRIPERPGDGPGHGPGSASGGFDGGSGGFDGGHGRVDGASGRFDGASGAGWPGGGVAGSGAPHPGPRADEGTSPSGSSPSEYAGYGAGGHQPGAHQSGAPGYGPGQPGYGPAPYRSTGSAHLPGGGAGMPPGPPLGTPGKGGRPEPRRRGGRGLIAGVVAAALIAGGAAGVGGAALFDRADNTGTTSSSSVTSAKVVDSGDQPAAKGSVEQVAASALPSVVKLSVNTQEGSGSGSGIILSSDGRILTNNHVAELAGQNGTIRVDFNDGSHADAKVLGTDPLTDIAVLQAEDVSGLTPATLGKSSNLDVGEGVVAVGSPYGLNATVTSGIVSALNRPVTVGTDSEGNSTTYPAIQTDAAINPGNSGGALLNMNGEVVGVNSSIRTADQGSQGSIGLGFAIPIDQVLPIVDELSQGDPATHARLGVSVTGQGNPEETEDGASVASVESGSGAAKAGLEKGDTITQVDNTKITGSESLIATVRSYRPGDTVTVRWTRGDKEMSQKVTLDSDGS